MPKINVESSYLNHPKTRRLKIYCGQEADIFPIRLWLLCAEYFPKEGVLIGYEASEIESVVGWNGPSGNLTRALEQVGFIEKTDKGYRIHDWRQHAGFIWNYKLAGSIAGKKSAVSRALRSTNRQRTVNETSTKPEQLNRIELNKDSIRDLKLKTEKELTGIQQIVLSFKEASGYPVDDKAWDSLNFSRCSKPAKSLLDFFGAAEDAAACVRGLSEEFTKKNLAFTLETIVKHASNWKRDNNKKEFVI